MSRHPLSFQRIELDAISPESDSESESDTNPVDWLAEALLIQHRLRDKEQPANETTIDYSPTQYPENDTILVNEQPDLQSPNDDFKTSIIKNGAETYELEKYEKNAMIIFNHESFFGSQHVRNYTMRDEEALEATFKKFRFTVEKHLDLPRATLMEKLNKFCAQDFSQYGCICAVVMTHGSKNGWLRAYDIRYSEQEIMDCFNVETNITLLGKPVIIIIQACRGDEPASANRTISKQAELDSDGQCTLPTEADRLIFHSSYFGRASVSVEEGSWFIQELCSQINTYADVDDFETICRAVRRNVAGKQVNMRIRTKKIVVKQMPIVTTCLTRLLYFKRCEGHYYDGTRKDKILESNYGPRKNAGEVDACHDYFNYLKRTLRLFIRENPHDEVASSILNVAENSTSIDRSSTAMVDLIRSYLNTNLDRFTHKDLVYLGGRHCCNKQRREENQYLCSII